MNTKLLRQKILDLAIRGKLTEQKKSDGTTKDLLKQIFSNVILSNAKNLGKSKKAPKEIIPLDKSEAPFEIPENWEWVRLGDVCEIKSSKRVFESDYVESGVPFYRSKEIGDLSRGEEIKTSLFIKKIHFDDLKEKYGVPQAGDVLITSVGTIGNTWICDGRDFYYKDGNITQIRKNLHIESKYIQLFLASPVFFKQALSTAAGTAQAALTIVKLNALLFPLPPLAEQQRIVTAIENAFAEITEIENNQELLKKHIKQGRQKILDLAIRGKLTQQLKTDGTTKDLLKQISSNVILSNAKNPAETVKSSRVILSKRSASKDLAKEIIPLDKTTAPFEIPENWEWVKLGDLSEKIQYGYNAPAKDCGRIKMVRISDIHENAVDWDSVPYCDIEESEIQTYLLKKNDILFARTGGTVGKSFIVNEVPEESVYAGYLIRTRYGENINAQYMKYFMESNLYWEQLRDGCIATAQPNCNGQTLGKMKIPLPPLAEQQRIVATIEQAFAEFDAMEVNL